MQHTHYRESKLLRSARWRANKVGLPCNLSLIDIKIPTHCPVLGMPLRFNKKRQGFDSPTLDRVIPELGYVKGNVIVISDLANRIKSTGTPLEILRVAKFYLRHLKEAYQ